MTWVNGGTFVASASGGTATIGLEVLTAPTYRQDSGLAPTFPAVRASILSWSTLPAGSGAFYVALRTAHQYLGSGDPGDEYQHALPLEFAASGSSTPVTYDGTAPAAGQGFDHYSAVLAGVEVDAWYPAGHPLYPGTGTGWSWLFDPTTGHTVFTGPAGTVTRNDPQHGPVAVPGVDNGDGTYTYTDPWPPLGQDVEYELDDGTGPTTVHVDTTVPGPDAGGTGAMPRLSVISQPALVLPPVTLIDYTGAYPARNTVHDILDRTDPVVVQREPGLRRGELTYVFDDHGDAMGIADAYRTGGKIALRQATHDRLDVVHIATGDVQITPEHGGLAWRLRVSYTEVSP